MTDENRILLIDDNESSRHDLETLFSFIGENIISATSSNWHSLVTDAVSESSGVCVAIIGDCQNIRWEELLSDIYQWEAGTPFVLLGERDIPEQLEIDIVAAITATLSFPLSYQPLIDALHKARVFYEHFNRLRDVDGVRDYNMFRSLIGNSDSIHKIRQMMGQVAHTEVSVLITGDSGTGKEVVARNLHLNSARADKPFVPINCGAIPRELLESELFGHEKGAFTGAISERVGRFELANGGTLFLDEIGDMPLNMQVKLLRVLQEKSFERVGGVKTIHTDVRIFAATHKDLRAMIDTGEFRQDLYYRINVFPIEMPSLNERTDDIPLLLNELIAVLETEKRVSVRFNSAAIASLCKHPWPGNVRELANLVERMAILFPHGIVGMSDLPENFRHVNKPVTAEATSADDPAMISSVASLGEEREALLPLNGLDLKEYLANLEKNLIGQALDDCGGVVARAADRLNIRRTTLVEKIRKYSLTRKHADVDQADTESKEDQQSDQTASV
ncbi:MAG: sigma-54 dependent transcriptional regulator [Gammaproteobacteria bacterium]|nr:sigma-54 dependent transcriptional regulator [Gammaproteobacteria bacterium]MDP7456147.1 sigma-54 dependent transcriptional regulator [Gammaproteobacteria bacterium]